MLLIVFEFIRRSHAFFSIPRKLSISAKGTIFGPSLKAYCEESVVGSDKKTHPLLLLQRLLQKWAQLSLPPAAALVGPRLLYTVGHIKNHGAQLSHNKAMPDATTRLLVAQGKALSVRHTC